MSSRRKCDSKNLKTTLLGSSSNSALSGRGQCSVLPLFPAAHRRARTKSKSDTLEKTLGNGGGDDIVITPCSTIIMQTTIDGKVQISRTQKEREKDPDRLSMDRRGLSKFPILIGETKLRLLSMQHNLLSKLEKSALLCLPHLVFLDIYNNKLNSMAPLICLHHLRVLLLGKNRITIIDGLVNMNRLEVLDLHGNQIVEINNLRSQKELKVLNLASNEIREIRENDLAGLITLQELNLRRNHLKVLTGFESTPQLLKLFLSHNAISTLDALSGIQKLQQLKEVSLDGNPVLMEDDNNVCLNQILSYCACVEMFGRLKVTEEMRRLAKVWRLRKQFKEKHDASFSGDVLDDVANGSQSASRKLVHQSVRKLSKVSSAAGRLRRATFSKKKTVSADSCYGSETSAGEYFKLPPILTASIAETEGGTFSMESNKSTKSIQEDRSDDDESSSSSESADEASSTESDQRLVEKQDSQLMKPIVPVVPKIFTNAPRIAQNRTPLRQHGMEKVVSKVTHNDSKNQQPIKTSTSIEKIKEQGNDYLVQLSGRHLNVTGRSSAKYIDRNWNSEKAHEISTVKFTCVSFNTLVPVFGRLKYRFPNAKHFVFLETDLNLVGQLNAFTDLGGLESLHIYPERNSIVTKHYWRSYAIYRLGHWGLKTINNIPVTEDEISHAKEEFQGLTELVLVSLPETLLTPLLTKLKLEINTVSAKQWLLHVDPVIRSVICKEALKWHPPSTLIQSQQLAREKGREQLLEAVEKACKAVFKLKKLSLHWNEILANEVAQAFSEYVEDLEHI